MTQPGDQRNAVEILAEEFVERKRNTWPIKEVPDPDSS